MTAGMSLVLAFLLGYFTGSIPFGLLLSKAAGYGDIRKIGSRNIGATNVLRTGNKALAAATLAADIFKGFLPAFLAAWYFGPIAGIAAGVAAFLGHLYPVWLKFRGGKGVATYIGILLAWAFSAGLAFCMIWLATAVATRYSSLSALVASALAPLIFLILGHNNQAVAALFISLLVFYKHKENITRLRMGEETKIGQEG